VVKIAEVSLHFERFPDDRIMEAARRIVLENHNADAILVAKALLDLVEDIHNIKGKVERR
jgi:hypothetical protein